MAQIQTKFIANNAVTNAKLALIPAHSYIGNNTGSSATAAYITNTQLTADLNLFTSSLQGLVPASGGGTTNFLRADGTFAAPPTSSGTVTSVALADGSTAPIFAISGSPVTTSGTLTMTLESQTANTVLAGPASGGGAQPTFRLLVSADIPNNAANTTGTASNVTGIVAIANGGTGQSTANAAFAALSPMTTAGDIIYENATPAPARLPIGTTGQVLTVSGGLPSWATPAAAGASVVGTYNSQTSSANGLVVSGADIYAQAATLTNPGMVIVPAAGGLTVSGTGSLSLSVDGSTVKINGSNQLESLTPIEQNATLSSTDITNQYYDLAHAVSGSSASVNSIALGVVGGPQQQKTVDYTVSLTGGVGGVTRISFAGDLATGGNAALVVGDILMVQYSYLA
jgi:hypothetical protein